MTRAEGKREKEKDKGRWQREERQGKLGAREGGAENKGKGK